MQTLTYPAGHCLGEYNALHDAGVSDIFVDGERGFPLNQHGNKCRKFA
jgi:hypothetical protein